MFRPCCRVRSFPFSFGLYHKAKKVYAVCPQVCYICLFLRQFEFHSVPKIFCQDTFQGKQSVRTLLRQNRGVSSVEISKTGIRGLERYAKKYGIDYAIRKDTSEVPPRYLVFFKAPDAEAFNSAFKEYSASLLNKDKRPSVLARLHELVQAAAELSGKVRRKQEERGL